MIGTGELIVIFLAILLLFGGKKLPELAKSLGQAMREFRSASMDPNDSPRKELYQQLVESPLPKEPKAESKEETLNQKNDHK